MDDVESTDPREPMDDPAESIDVMVKEGKLSFFPSPDAIAAECEAIQAGWTADQRSSRRTGLNQRHLPQMTVPTVRVSDLVAPQ